MGSSWLRLSRELTGSIPMYGGGPGPVFAPDKAVRNGDSCSTSRWQLSSHTGTHVDAPRHFHAGGAAITDYPAGFWVFDRPTAVPVPLPPGASLITPELLPWERIPADADLLLLDTGFGACYGRESYWRENPGIHPDVAGCLRRHSPTLRGIGFDFISVSSWQDRETGREAHRSFLDPALPPILLFEDMDLSPLLPGTRLLRIVALPLMVSGADGSPCTILAEVEPC